MGSKQKLRSEQGKVQTGWTNYHFMATGCPQCKQHVDTWWWKFMGCKDLEQAVDALHTHMKTKHPDKDTCAKTKWEHACGVDFVVMAKHLSGEWEHFTLPDWEWAKGMHTKSSLEPKRSGSRALGMCLCAPKML